MTPRPCRNPVFLTQRDPVHRGAADYPAGPGQASASSQPRELAPELCSPPSRPSPTRSLWCALAGPRTTLTRSPSRSAVRSSLIIHVGNTNHALVGLTPDQAAELKVDYPAGGVPSVDADIERCEAIPASDAGARMGCWADFDKQLMEQVVPWVPLDWDLSTRPGRAQPDEVRVRPGLGQRSP